MKSRFIPLLALLSVAMGPCSKHAAPAALPSVGSVSVVRGGVSIEAGGASSRIASRARIPRDGTLRSGPDARSTLVLDTGAFVLVDRDTELTVHLDRLELRRGRVYVDGRGAAATTVETPQGRIDLRDAAASIRVQAQTEAYATAGELPYHSPRGADRFVQGETLRLGSGAPAVEPAAVFDDWTGGLATPARPTSGEPSFVGEIDARSESVRGAVGEPMSLRSHEIVATVQDDLVRTDVVQTFFNGESETVDGEYRVRIPSGAVVERFEIDRGAGFETSVVSQLGASLPLEPRMAAIGVARLAYDGPDRMRARILGIAPGQTLRVRITTTSWLARVNGVRRLTLPLGGEAASPLVGELSVRVDASASQATRVAAGYGAEVTGKVVTYRASDVRPRADFVVELVDEQPRTSARAYTGQRAFEHGRLERFVRIDLPTETLVDDAEPRSTPLDLLVLLDTSGGTDAEDLELARATVEAIVAQLAPDDRLAVRMADVGLHALPGVAEMPTRLAARERDRLLEAVASAQTGGATDLGTVLRQAATALAGRANGAVLYLGDGLPTDGAMSATSIRRELELVDDPPRIFALGLGDDANLGLLRATLGEAASTVRDRDEASREVLALLAEAGRPVLRDLRVDLGPNVEQVFPRGPSVVPVSESTSVVARLVGELPTEARVRARYGERTLERRFAIEARAEIGNDDVPRRWASARLRQLLDDDAGREAIVELGLGFDLITPYTPRVVGLVTRVELVPWLGLDDAARETAFALSGGATGLSRIELGERRGFHAYDETDTQGAVALESTWQEHELDAPLPGVATDGGLARASVERALALGSRGPQSCYERKLLQRPDLIGNVSVRVTVDGAGRVTTAVVVSSSLGAEDVDRCVLDEVRGLAYPATGTATVTVDHVFFFQIPGRRIGMPHRCSLASERDLDTRKRLFAERISVARQNGGGVPALTEIFRQAQDACELGDWRARRTLATMLLDALPGLSDKLELYRSFADDAVVAPYARRAILRSLRASAEIAMARAALGLAPSLDFTVFARAYAGAPTKEAKLALVRRWLEVAPDDVDLRLRLLSLLEETGKTTEARRIARALHQDPLCDARARARVGEFWLRQNDRPEAIRVFSELVERAPLDPWARRRLGDLYLAHGFVDDALREYGTLARLRPDDSTNLLLLARAAGAAGRIDEALRLEQRVSEEADDDVEEGLSGIARAFTTVRLAELRSTNRDPALRRALDDRLRATGVLRRPPSLVVSLVYSHPDDRLTLGMRGPDVPESEPFTPSGLAAPELGIASFQVLEREPGGYRVHIERADARDLRESRAKLVVIENLGTPQERTTVRELVLTRENRTHELTIGG